MYSNKLKSVFMLGLIIVGLLLAACEDESRPTRTPQLSLVAPTFAPLIDTLPAPSPQAGSSYAPPPTPADIVSGSPLPRYQIFITPPPLATFEASRNYGYSGRISAANLKPENLTLINGVPLIPYIAPPQTRQPTPTLLPNYGTNGRPRVGLQIGHLDIDKLPDEWAALRNQTGGSGGGYTEVQINYDIARRTAALLISRGVTVDLLPATVPPAYTADAFVAIHCDAVTSSSPSGFKLAHYWNSAIPKTEDTLVNSIYSQYEATTLMKRDGSITDGMTEYYSFNSAYRYYAISKATPGAIIELGFLTNPNDTQILVNRADNVARGLANGIIVFLNQRPPFEQREKPIGLASAIEARLDRTPIFNTADSGNVIAYVSRQQVFTNYTENNSSYGIWLPILEQGGFIKKSDAAVVSITR
ncbi:N-acetylmuramoyl-L-alanine amidase [Candidatus Chlorohelix sp.]|uniref:N-acetylmuramoyl-L-alanine amidase n=1 Tax=Candidatus Chlorohelix sp. TaxID=3139201 RepID=UPI0030448A38